MITLVLEPVRQGRYCVVDEAGDDIIIVSARTPIFDVCRAMLRGGMAPETVLQVRHKGSPIIAYRIAIGRGARLTVTETDKVGPIIAPWRAFPAQRLRAGTADNG